VNQLVQFKVW